MLRIRSEARLRRTLERILFRVAGEISQVVRRDVVESVVRSMGGSPPKVLGAARERAVILCPVDDCGRPGAGPKYGWFCREHHATLSPDQKAAAQAARRERPRQAHGAAPRGGGARRRPRTPPRRK